ncbi:aldose epimerase [Leptospira kanakyensis]|uniref:Aldose epimerase n=1 Tax=Leptospira kanakyensis TaxID=2484968 RepID=A0A6N4Q5Z6_9LEPT|nr:aldose epimerase [Leptospira kanakyensis]MCW7470582.1 aldose epimerase [Leptospira kanakyensis]MCW7481647.1 aldose epimerase [Leptospira kanakyensis]TGK53816.1 aldose epimerase [Leptospira kanakyensis]TGK57611.1 aldose epimerase [Leptospira kanakyensis]TGK73321.1 aldose epimerase [Leptospira kanakyensis]
MKVSTLKKKTPKQITSSDELELKSLWHRLETKGLLQDHKADLSFRLPGKASFLLIHREEGKKSKPEINEYKIENPTDSLRIHLMSDETLNLIRFHASLYSLRPDIGAIASFQPHWSSLLKTLDHPLPLVFDEQCRQLGAPVMNLPKHIDGSVKPSSIILGGANAFLDEDNVVITSVTRDKAIYNCELIEKCSKAYLLAHSTGSPINNIPWWVRFIAKTRLLKDEKKASAAYARGEKPTGFKAY